MWLDNNDFNVNRKTIDTLFQLEQDTLSENLCISSAENSSERFRAWVILGDPGAAGQDDVIFSGEL